MTVTHETLLVQRHDGIVVIALNRPGAMNALNNRLMDELTEVLDACEADDAVGCMIITGSGRAFAAGADIKEMATKTYPEAYSEDFLTRNWERTARCRKPVIAAVNGVALGGGCELAMMCDFILAADTAEFGQPEITVGLLPGAGGTQRLARFIGKSKTMEMCLTGRRMDAAEAERCGLVSRVLPAAELMTEALKVARRLCDLSRPMLMMAKEAVNRAYDTPLTEGIKVERRLAQSAFAFADQKEGAAAFIEKRKPAFGNH